MAASTSRALSLSVVFLLFTIISEARDFIVGNTMQGWQIPGGNETDLNDWAEQRRFQIGDAIVFPLNGGNSALEVNEADYTNCRTTNAKATYIGVNNKAFLYRSGDFFFISGQTDNCNKGQKLQVKVLARRDQTPGGSIPSSGKSDVLPPPTGQEATLPTPTGQAAPLQSGSTLASTVTAMQVGFLLFTLGMLVIRLF